jgi:3-mercaptopyruvate sulfurtransferase SseA
MEDAFKAHCAERITKEAVFYDHDEIANKQLNLPIPLPPLDVFVENMKKINVPRNVPVVVYDIKGMYSAPRCH